MFGLHNLPKNVWPSLPEEESHRIKPLTSRVQHDGFSQAPLHLSSCDEVDERFQRAAFVSLNNRSHQLTDLLIVIRILHGIIREHNSVLHQSVASVVGAPT